MYRNSPCKAIASPKGYAAGVNPPFKSPPTTNLEEQDITVKVHDYS